MKSFRYFLLFAILLSASLTLAQDATPEPTAEGEEAYVPRTREELEEALGWTCPEGLEGGTLSIYNWSTYIADNTVPDFEALCGVTVIYDTFASNEEALARLRQGNPGYDIVVPSDYVIQAMVEEGLVEPLDHANIPNLVNLAETFVDPVYDPGNAYSVPYLWGTVGIGYNTEAVTEPIDSWGDVFAHEGNVAWLEDGRTMLGNALLLNGFDPNSTDEAEIEIARDYLIANGGNVVSVAQDDGQVLLQRGEADIVVEYNGDIFQIMAEAEDPEQFAYVIPSEGTGVWVDNMAIPLGAPNHRLAEAFMDYVLLPQVAADIANYVAYASPNQAAIDQELIDAELLENPGIYPSEETQANLWFIQSLPDFEMIYADAWDQVKLSLGQ